MSKKSSRTYARNRTNLSRRGQAKFTDPDGVFFLKLIVLLIVSSLWLKLKSPIMIGAATVNAFPFGMILALLINRLAEKRINNRQIWYVVIIIVGIISYFLPAGIVL